MTEGWFDQAEYEPGKHLHLNRITCTDLLPCHNQIMCVVYFFLAKTQMACKEFGLDAQPGTLALTHKRVPVDLSQPFRFTGIPQNATLELTVSDQSKMECLFCTSQGA